MDTPKCKRTGGEAIAAGISDYVWTIEEIVALAECR
jgi:hypothetical protein